MARPNPLHHGRYWDNTWNPVTGCRAVDEGCRNCYAIRDAGGLHRKLDIPAYRDTTRLKADGTLGWSGRLNVLSPGHPSWDKPLNWKGSPKPLLGLDKPSLLWIGSTADVFMPGRPPEVIDRIVTTVALSGHIGLFLSKHPEQMAEYFSTQPAWRRRWIWLGFSAGEQWIFDERWGIMRPLAQQGWLIFVSLQPLLELVILPPDFLALARVWVLIGGEQSPGHRIMDLDWARSIFDQCEAAGVPFFAKQMTKGWLPPDLHVRQFPKI